ncbi:MAG: cytidylate kinase [Acidimicrobiales bacterium]|nr:cytidylate kinase [Acidimicrobiales bacterium]
MLVTVSGLPGSGTSTVARRVAPTLGVEHVDGGSVFRMLAAERGLALHEFAALAEQDDTIDRALDARLTERARAGDVVLESRLAGWLTHQAGIDALRVWIDCDEVVRAARVGDRDGHSAADALSVNQEREASERLRYHGYYGIDLLDLGLYDLVLDSCERRPDDLVDEIVAAARARFA